MRRAVIALVFFLSFSASWGQQKERKTIPSSPPSLPVIDVGACPFDGCTFGKWTVTKDSILYTSWKSGRLTHGSLNKGEIVVGLTGVHITIKPDRIRVLQPLPELGLKPGDVGLRYMYLGEGFANVWANGKYVKETDCTFITEKNGEGCMRDCQAVVEIAGEKEWWVQVKKSSGQVGWTKAENNFEGIDAFASMGPAVTNPGN